MGLDLGSRRSLTVSTVVLFAGIFVLHLTLGDDAALGAGFLYAIPITLVAMEYGLRAGVGAGVLAAGLVLAWEPLVPADLTLGAFLVRGVTFVWVGALVGYFAGVRTAERSDLLARLDRLAHTDELTGLPNRRAWEAALDGALARADRAASPVAVAVIDLDRFKSYNDLNGHQAGDRLLAEAAALWRESLRAGDTIARVGGEEFAVLMAGPAGHSRSVCERLRRLIPDGQTCSVGLAVRREDEPAGEIYRRADLALYDAKGRGRNQVVEWDPPDPSRSEVVGKGPMTPAS